MALDIIEFLTARLDEDERIAKVASLPAYHGSKPHPELFEWQYAGDEVEYVPTPEMLGHGYYETEYVTCDSEGLLPSVDNLVGPHIARHDPARVLREVAAKRHLIEQHVSYYGDGEDDYFPVSTLSTIAGVYADHHDFDPRWAF